MDLDTNEVVRQPGQAGEMRVRSPGTMLGYIGNPEATADCYDEEGWFKTGDLVSFDEDGFFFYVDRLKEMIKYRAHQVGCGWGADGARRRGWLMLLLLSMLVLFPGGAHGAGVGAAHAPRREGRRRARAAPRH